MTIVLTSARLRVEIAAPGVPPSTTIRFDRAGFVTQVTLDGRHRFCTREPDNLPHPCSGGYGLCSEYRCNEPVDEAELGAPFPKFGVGLLTKDLDGRFVFHHNYPCEPFPVTTEASESAVTFVTASVPCGGYAARTTKVLRVEGNALTMAMTLENVGERPLAFQEYCHNFVTLDRLPIGPDYYLSLPVAPQDGKPARGGVALCGQGQGVGFARYSNEPSFFMIPPGEVTSPAPFTWRLSNRRSPAAIAETVSVLPAMILVWSIDHIISPEIICSFQTAPGESVTWTRRWVFDD